MTLETSTANVVLGVGLGGVLALQTWIIKELIALRIAVTRIQLQCVALHGRKIAE